jgi:hypothetical protein
MWRQVNDGKGKSRVWAGLVVGFEGQAATVERSGRRREEIYSGVDEWRTVRIGGACAISIAQAVCVSASVVCEMSESAETRRILLKRKISVSSGHKAKRTAETRIVQTDGSRATPRVLQPRSLASASEHLAHLVGNEPF